MFCSSPSCTVLSMASAVKTQGMIAFMQMKVATVISLLRLKTSSLNSALQTSAVGFIETFGDKIDPYIPEPVKSRIIRAASFVAPKVAFLKAKAAEPTTKVTAASAAGGAVAVGSAAGAVGLGAGAGMGVLFGLMAAPFTLGLSIPVGTCIGGGVGAAAGSALGGTAGFVTGGAVGYGAYTRRDQLQAKAQSTVATLKGYGLSLRSRAAALKTTAQGKFSKTQ